MKDCVSHMIFLLFFFKIVPSLIYISLQTNKQNADVDLRDIAHYLCGPLSLVELEKGMCDQSLHSIFLTL